MGNKHSFKRRSSAQHDSFGDRLPSIRTASTKHYTSKDIHQPPTSVLQRVIIGNRDDSLNDKLLEKLGVTHILSLCSSYKKPSDQSIKYKNEAMDDYGEDNVLVKFAAVWDTLIDGTTGKNKVFIHCRKGVNRSVVVGLLFLMIHEGFSLQDALNHVTSLRTDVNIHPNYMAQLKEIDAKLKDLDLNKLSEASSAELIKMTSIISIDPQSTSCAA